MKSYVCIVCGYVYEGEEAPVVCPVCGVGADQFMEAGSEPAPPVSRPSEPTE